MASKKTVAKKRSPKDPKVKILIELSRRARREVDKLLKQSIAGTIDSAELNMGLNEAEAPLKQMLDYVKTTLSDLSQLQKLSLTRTLSKKQLNTKLKAVRRRMKLMSNHGNGEPWLH